MDDRVRRRPIHGDSCGGTGQQRDGDRPTAHCDKLKLHQLQSSAASGTAAQAARGTGSAARMAAQVSRAAERRTQRQAEHRECVARQEQQPVAERQW